MPKDKPEILEEREYKGRLIVLGRDNRQYMIGVKEARGTIKWKKFFSNLPPAQNYGGALGLTKAYFYDLDGLSKEFGPLFYDYEIESKDSTMAGDKAPRDTKTKGKKIALG